MTLMTHTLDGGGGGERLQPPTTRRRRRQVEVFWGDKCVNVVAVEEQDL